MDTRSAKGSILNPFVTECYQVALYFAPESTRLKIDGQRFKLEYPKTGQGLGRWLSSTSRNQLTRLEAPLKLAPQIYSTTDSPEIFRIFTFSANGTQSLAEFYGKPVNRKVDNGMTSNALRGYERLTRSSLPKVAPERKMPPSKPTTTTTTSSAPNAKTPPSSAKGDKEIKSTNKPKKSEEKKLASEEESEDIKEDHSQKKAVHNIDDTRTSLIHKKEKCRHFTYKKIDSPIDFKQFVTPLQIVLTDGMIQNIDRMKKNGENIETFLRSYTGFIDAINELFIQKMNS